MVEIDRGTMPIKDSIDIGRSYCGVVELAAVLSACVASSATGSVVVVSVLDAFVSGCGSSSGTTSVISVLDATIAGCGVDSVVAPVSSVLGVDVASCIAVVVACRSDEPLVSLVVDASAVKSTAAAVVDDDLVATSGAAVVSVELSAGASATACFWPSSTGSLGSLKSDRGIYDRPNFATFLVAFSRAYSSGIITCLLLKWPTAKSAYSLAVMGNSYVSPRSS